MLKSGLVSVSFRGLACEEIVALAAKAGLQGIEWGGDVHVPPEDIENARRVGALTRAAGLEVASYGSYYRLGSHGPEYKAYFSKVLDAAAALGAPVIRIWAGTLGSAQTPPEQRLAWVEEAKTLACMAAERGLVLAFECHGNTLTDRRVSAVRLMHEIGSEYLRMYWPPNDCYPFAENLQALRDLLPWFVNIHVFQWPSPGVRQPLKAGECEWLQYLSAAGADGKDHWCMLEFMPDDDPASLPEEAAALISWLK